MIHCDSEGEGGISLLNGSRHVFAHLEALLKPSKHLKFKSCAHPESPGIKKVMLKEYVSLLKSDKRTYAFWKNLKKGSNSYLEIRRSAPCHMKLP